MSYRFHLSRYNKKLFEELRNLKLSDAELATENEGEYFLPDMRVGTDEVDDLYIGKYDIWSKYEAEDEGVFIAYASIHGNTAKAAKKFAEILKEKGVDSVLIVTDKGIVKTGLLDKITN